MDHNGHNLKLPNNVVGVMDINRLHREMLSLNDFMHQASIREPGSSMSLPKMSRSFDEVAESNGLNLLQQEDREKLTKFLTAVKEAAPRLHISFSVDPSPLFLGRLMDYLRGAIDPFVLVQVGLQPNIGAGCVVRSTNKVFDLSLRENFRQKRGLLMQYVAKLEANNPSETTEPASPDETAQPQASEPTEQTTQPAATHQSTEPAQQPATETQPQQAESQTSEQEGNKA